MRARLEASPLWICVDGVEGAGKTTLVSALATSLGAVVAPEFSASAVGHALRDVVRNAPHYISTSRVGQSLAFVGDFHETFESAVQPALDRGQIVVSDRGWLSKYAYQAQVLTGLLDQERIDKLLCTVLELPRLPDLTFYLDIDLESARSRLVVRDGACAPERAEFISGAIGQFRRLVAGVPGAPHLNVQTIRGLDVTATAARAQASAEELLRTRPDAAERER